MEKTKGRGVDLESIESPDGERVLLAHAKGTGDTVRVVGLRDGAGGRARGQLGTSVVAMDVGGAVPNRWKEGGTRTSAAKYDRD